MLKLNRCFCIYFKINCFILRNTKVFKRTILSTAYKCDDDWNKRLNSPIFTNIKTLDFITQLKEKYDFNKRIDAIDIDIVANKLQDLEPHQLDFAEELFYSFRHSEDAINVIESTPHALLRNLMLFREDERISRMLKDKINYGIFLDHFSANLLFDYFIKKNDFSRAANVAYDLMLQEDIDNELTQAFILYIAYQRLKQIPLNAEPRIIPNQSEMEVKYVKVNYIPTIWYDDHFDLPNEHAKLGKTIEMIVSSHNQQYLDLFLNGIQIIGLGLGLKFNESLNILDVILNNEPDIKIASQSVDHFEKMLLDVKTAEKTPAIEPSLLRLVHLYPYITEEEKNKFIHKFQEQKSKLLASNRLVSVDVANEIKNRLDLAVQKHENEHVHQLQRLYYYWSACREDLVTKQIEAHNLTERKRILAERLMELTKRDEKLRFFEENSSIEIAVHSAKQLKEKQVDLKLKEEEEQFVLPPGERKSSTDGLKKEKSTDCDSALITLLCVHG